MLMLDWIGHSLGCDVQYSVLVGNSYRQKTKTTQC